MTMPKCYRCRCQPCECADRITLYHCRKLRDVVKCNQPEGDNLQAGLTTSTSEQEVYTWLIPILSSASVPKQESEQGGIEPASEARMFRSVKPVGLQKDTSKPRNTLPNGSVLENNTTHGRGVRSQWSLGDAAQSEHIPMYSRAKTVDRSKLSDTTLTETR